MADETKVTSKQCNDMGITEEAMDILHKVEAKASDVLGVIQKSGKEAGAYLSKLLTDLWGKVKGN